MLKLSEFPPEFQGVVRHQAGPHLDIRSEAIFSEQVAIKRMIAVAEEGPRTAVATLGDVMWATGDDDTGEADHAARCMETGKKSVKCTVTVIAVIAFVISGPGSRRGLNRIKGRPKDTPWTDAAWQNAFRRFEAAIGPELQPIGLSDLHCQDLQNCLCEVDKYLRGTLGEGKPKRRFAAE